MLNVLDFVFPVLLGIAVMVNVVMAVVLWKGKICPGQRRRLIKQGRGLTVLWLSTLAAGAVSLENSVLVFLVAVAGIAYEFSRHQPVRARNALFASAIVGVFAFIAALFVLPAKAVMVVSLLTSGAAVTHTLMVSARCRLQAFYRLLPATGLLGILAACAEAVRSALNVNLINAVSAQYATAGALLMLAAAFVIWIWPEFSKEKPGLGRMAVVSAICVISNLFNGAINIGYWI